MSDFRCLGRRAMRQKEMMVGYKATICEATSNFAGSLPRFVSTQPITVQTRMWFGTIHWRKHDEMVLKSVYAQNTLVW